ncbi:hypothetical protein [Pseudonocardia sp. KRD291]|uniref:hypothetical protein n=1 Tax=Pseudonocardia sp. KRD291 TaxID=2792007 RepID=UPI001CF799ED|nr:hypothetical protein [Pseudonocardia sp. KRD291]
MQPPEQPGQDNGPAQRLAVEAARAARVRALSTDPDVIALRVERVRMQVDRLMWSGIVLGLGFTMTNVQTFAAAGAPPWSTPWVAAWALDPMVSLVLIAVLRAEQVTARWQVRTGPWVRRARWGTLAATYIMNTWSAWAHGIPSQVVLHSVPPLVVFVAAEAVTGLREALSDAVHAAAGRGQQAGSTAADRPSGGEVAAAVEPGEIRAEPPPAEVNTTGPNAPHASPRPEHTTPRPVTDENRASTAGHPDTRVMELAELLASGAPVTGAQAAALYRCSPRNGRRLLAAAQTTLAASTATSPAELDEPTGGAMVLALPARAGWS